MLQALKWDRTPISAPGWYDGVPISVYHSAAIVAPPHRAISSSGLRTAWKRSLKHFYANWPHNPEFEPAEETEAFVFGRAAHHLFLGEDDFALSFIERPTHIAGKPWHGNRTDCIDFIKAQERAGRSVLKPDEVKAIRGMARSLAAEPEAVDLLQGAVEQTLIARDEETGLWLKARPDVIPTADGLFADLKTTISVVDVDLYGTLRSYAYHQQGALIWEVCEMLGIPFTGFALVMVEKKKPFCVRVIEMTDDDLAYGRMQNRAMLRKIAAAIDADHWPGPGKHPGEFFSLPATERERIDNRLKELEAA
jgi:hypothetical protein